MQLTRILGLLALLVVAHPVLERLAPSGPRCPRRAPAVDLGVLAVIAIAFVAAALLGRARRHPAWLLAVEGIIAVLAAVVMSLPGAPGGFIYAFTGFEETLGPVFELAIMLNPAWRWFGQVLALAWLVIVAEAAIGQTRAVPRQAVSSSAS